MSRQIDVPRLFRVWNNPSFKTEEVAAILQLPISTLYDLAKRHGLPKRTFVRRKHDDDESEPSPAEVSEYQSRKAEIDRRHLEAMRNR